jgi:hypothetical protein
MKISEHNEQKEFIRKGTNCALGFLFLLIGTLVIKGCLDYDIKPNFSLLVAIYICYFWAGFFFLKNLKNKS